MKSFSRIKNGKWRLPFDLDKVRRIWKDYFEEIYDANTKERVTVHMYGSDGIQRGNYFEGKPIRRNELDVRVRTL